MAKLHLLPETPGAEPFEIMENMVLIGRKPDNTLQVEDANVSKYHALLAKTEDGYRLFDLHSANGTFVNDRRITTTIIKHNDHFRVGPAVFRLESEPAQAPVAPPTPAAQPKVRLGGRLGGAPLGRKPAAAPTTIDKPPTDPTLVLPTATPVPTPAPTPAPMTLPSLIPEPAAPPPAPVVATTAPPPPAIPVAETAPASTPGKKEEPRVSIKIPESKKSIISPPRTTSDAKETQENAPLTQPTEPEAPPNPRPGLGLKRPAAPAPVAAPQPPPPPEPAPVPAPAPAPTPPPSATTLGGPKPPSGERTLRPKLGGGGGGEVKLKLKK